MKLKRTSLFLTEAQLEKLQTIQKLTGCPVAEQIRRFVDAGLAKKGKK